MGKFSQPFIWSLLLGISISQTGCFDMGFNGPAIKRIVRTDDDSTSAGSTVDQNTLYVKVSSGSNALVTHALAVSTTYTDPSDYVLPCEIDVNNSATDMVCLAEANELDLYFNGATISYNFPGNVCSYARFTPYWYFRWQVGMGVKYLRQVVDNASPANVTWYESNTGTSASWVVTTAYQNEKCPYDYRQIPGGPNCCLGKYDYIYEQWNPTTLVYDKTTVTGKSWGGEPGNCLGGPAVDTQQRDPFFHTPIGTYKAIESNGLAGQYKVKSPYSQLFQSNIFVSNFYDAAADHAAGLPQPLRAISFAPEFSGTPADAYIFECLDRSSAVLHRIKLYIREWNEKADLETFAGGAAASSDGASNDFRDWKDASAGASGGYPTTAQ